MNLSDKNGLDNIGLNDDEKTQLLTLLRRMKNTDIRGPIWHTLVTKFPTIAFELIVLDDQNRVLLIHRDDEEFPDCWHHPGSVWNDWETLPERLEKLVKGEIIKGAGIEITKPESIGWLAVYRGDDKVGALSNPTRNFCALVQLAYLKSEFTPKEGVGFFPLNDLPENTLACHRYIISRVEEYLKTGVSIAF